MSVIIVPSESASFVAIARARASVFYLGTCFFVLFAGVGTFRSLVPAIKPSSGSWLVAVNFVAYGFGSLLHPRFLFNRRRLCLVVAALAHAQWIALLQLPTGQGNALYDAIASVSSIVNGSGAGLLWATQGGWMGEVCRLDADRRNAARYSGIFLTFYGASGIIGNIVAALTFHFGLDVISIVWYLFGVSLAGVALLACTPRRLLYVVDNRGGGRNVEQDEEDIGGSMHSALSSSDEMSNEKCTVDDDDGMQSALEHSSSSGEEEDVKEENRPLSERVRAEWRDWRRKRIGVVPIGASRRFAIERDLLTDDRTVAVEAARRRFARLYTIRALFTQTVFPRALPIIAALSSVSAFLWVAMAKALRQDVVPIVFAAYAAANACGPPLGALLDRRFGTKPALLIVTIALALPVCVYFVALHPLLASSSVPISHSDYAMGTLACVFGVVIGAYNNAIYALFATEIDPQVASQTTLLPDEQEHLPGEAFCMHGFFYCIFYAVFSFLSGIIDLRGMAALATSVVVVAIGALALWIKKR